MEIGEKSGILVDGTDSSKAIQAVLGWDQVAMVDRYAHFVDELQKDAADKMDAILKPVAVKLAVKPTGLKAN